MLSTFRTHIKGWLAWAFIILISVPFALWGIGNYSSVITSSGVATVNGEEIAPQAFQNAYRNAFQQRQQALGGKYDPTAAEEKALKQQTLEQLITQTLLRQQASQYNMIANAARVRQQIRSLPVFQVNGKFSFQQYRAVLAANQLTPEQFEAQVQTNLKSRILQTGLAGSSFATPSLANDMIGLVNQQRKLSWISLPSAQFKPAAPPSDQAVQAYYQAHKKAFTTPMTLTLHYVQLDPETLKTDIKTNKTELLAWYHSHLSDFGTPPARKAAEILVAPQGGGDRAWAEARQQANELRAEMQKADNARKKFAELASKHSDDPISRRNNGSIGYVGRGQMPAPFDTALFGIETVGGVAGPIRTEKGWVLIQYLDEREGKVQPFAEVKSEVKSDYLESRVSDRYFDLGNKLANLAFEHPGSLTQVADELDLQIKTVSGVTREEGTGIASNDAVRKAAFSNSVLKERMNSEPVKLADFEAVVLRVAEAKPSELKPLSSVRDNIVALINQSRAQSAARQAADQAVAALHSGTETLTSVARSLKVPVRGPSTITRAAAAASVPAAVIAAAFDEPVPTAGKTIYGRVLLDNDNQAVYALQDVVTNREMTITPQERQAYLAQLTRIHAQQEMNAYIDWLHAHADIKINESNIP